MPCSICAPPAASGPVLTVRKPSRSGSVCAVAPECRTPSDAASTRTRMPCMRIPPCAQALISPVRGQPGDSFDDVPLRARILRFQKNRQEARQKSAGRYPLPLPQHRRRGEGRAPQPGAVRFSRQVLQRHHARGEREAGQGPRRSADEHRDGLKDMDRMGIDVQAIAPAPHQTYYWCEPGEGADLARTVNERIAAIVAQWPERFVGLGTVPLQDSGLAVSELEYGVKKLGLRGVEINPSVNGMDLTDSRLSLDRFFSKVQELDVVIFMHPIGFTHGERLVDHYFNNVIGNPLETTVAASHLIFDGVMERYPRLQVVLPHGGGYLAHYWARMDHAHRARPDCRVS